jgi:putative sterol carrier protein
MPPGVFPFDPEASAEEVAARQVKLMEAGVLGPPDGPAPDASPETQRLYFDVVKRAADPAAANGSPLVYQYRFSDAEPWQLIIDNGSTRAEPGEAPNPTLTLETSWADFVAIGKPEAKPLQMMLQRRLRPRGKLREIARMRKVFPS